MLITKYFFHLLYNIKIKKNVNLSLQLLLIYSSLCRFLIFELINQEIIYFYKEVNFKTLFLFKVNVPNIIIFNNIILAFYTILKTCGKIHIKYNIIKKSRFFYVLQVFIKFKKSQV